MRILMYRWKAYNQYDLIENLRERGHIVDEIKGELINYEEDDGFSKRFNARLDEVSYDMVITINYFPLISDICLERDILYVSWCCDCPIATMYHESVFNKVNKIFCFDKINYLTFADMGAPVYYLPLCAATERVDRLLSQADDLDKYESDVSFIGSMYRKNSYDEICDHLPDYLRGYFDAAMKIQMNIYGEYFLPDILNGETVAELNRNFFLAKTDRSFSDLSLIFSTTVLGFKIAQMERQTMIAELSRHFKVDVYTDDPDQDFVFATNKGTADYWNEAPKIFNRSKINLNFTIRNIQSGIPLRVWDILGAGGFCITNFQPELLMYFENGKDIVYFENKEDLVQKIDYYLKHEDERKQIAMNGYLKVKELHGYRQRLDEMSQYIKGL